MPPSLANEVLSLIFHAVDSPRGLLSARAACRAFDALASPLIFTELKVRVDTAVRIAHSITTGSALADNVKVVHFNVTDEDEALPFEDFEEEDQNNSSTDSTESPSGALSDIFGQLHRFSKLCDITITLPECFEFDDDEPSPMCRLQTAVLYYCGKSKPPKALRSFTFTNLWPYPLTQTIKNGGLRHFLSTILSFRLVISKDGYYEGAYCSQSFMDFFGGDFNALLACLPAELTTLSIKNPLLHCWTGSALPRFPSLTSLRLETMLFFKPYSLTGEIVQRKDYNTFEGFILRHGSIEHLTLVACSMDVPDEGFDTDRTWASFVNKGLREYLPNLKQLHIAQRGIALGLEGQVVRGGGYARLDVGYAYVEASSLDGANQDADARAIEKMQEILSLRRASYVN